MSALPTLLVFSHLRWGPVCHRPQQLMSRLAGRWHVLFVEEPTPCTGRPWLEARDVGPALTVLVPHLPGPAGGFHGPQQALLQSLLAGHLRPRGLRIDVAWLCTPMALHLATATQPVCLVYDCLVDWSGSGRAPRQLHALEAALMKRADLVLTDGPALYASRCSRNPQVHCFPSAVDAAHFAAPGIQPGSAHALAARTLQGQMARPRLGYFGVIDERLDGATLALLADRHPAWSIVMAGPELHPDAAALPQRPNIHWLGAQPYDRLPHLLASWDLCLLPFAMNAGTQCLNPGQTLEYMAGDKPVVGTPLHDIVALYGDAVAVADPGETFVEACETVLAESGAARCRRAMAMLQTVSAHSWGRSAAAVHALMAKALAQAHAQTQTQVRVLPHPVAVAEAIAPLCLAAVGGH